MVEHGGAGADSSAVPTIAELLLAYRDRTGDSYADMSRKVRNEIHISRLQQLATAPPREFPKQPRTVELLAELLEVPITTIVLGFAAGLGIPVSHTGSMLERTLPPGTDSLTAEDREAIRAVTRALVDARTAAAHGGAEVVDLLRPPAPDLSSPALAARWGESEGRRRRQAQDDDADR